MAALSQRQKADLVEYAVYIHLPANQNSRFWERASITNNEQLALEQAEMLFESQKYPRVEVTRKFFCRKQKKQVSEKIRVFEQSLQPTSLYAWLEIIASIGKRFWK